MSTVTERTRYVFVDESGDTSLPGQKSDAPDFYVICALLIRGDNLGDAETRAAEITGKHAGSGELKSSTIGSNSKRRSQILTDIGAAKVPFYCLAVNKSRIYRESGLRWRHSFYMFLHRMIYSRIRNVSYAMQVIADQYDHSDFMDRFIRYMRGGNSLFEQYAFVPSKDVPLLQIADTIAGSVRRVFRGEEDLEILETVGYPSVPIEEWPPEATGGIRTASPRGHSEFDDAIVKYALKMAREFVEKNTDENTNDPGAEAIRYLLVRFAEHPDTYVYRSEIVEYLRESHGIEMAEHELTSRVLSAARDQGVILASTDRGVKIPYRLSDVQEWVKRIRSQTVPNLQRLGRARQDILLATENKCDIIDEAEFPEISRFLRPSIDAV